MRKCGCRSKPGLHTIVATATTVALVALLHTITQALETNPYVVIIALDFSKAFNTVRHSSVMEKIAHCTTEPPKQRV